MDENRDILVVSADRIIETNFITFRFMMDVGTVGKLRPMPQKYGYVWQTDPTNFCLNVIEGGKGIIVSAGWGEGSNDSLVKEIFESLPSCTLLMSTQTFQSWEIFCKKHEVKFRHYHHNETLKTS